MKDSEKDNRQTDWRPFFPKCFVMISRSVPLQDKCHGGVADKYVEFEQITVFIDLALLQTPAYRHVLFNTDFVKYWKYSIILIFIEAYLLWNHVFSGVEDPEFYNSGEKGFYVSCLIVLTEHVLFFSLIYGFMCIFGQPCSARLLWKAITLSNFSKLLFIPVMIWRDSSLWELGINYLLILGYSIMSLICSLSGETELK